MSSARLVMACFSAEYGKLVHRTNCRTAFHSTSTLYESPCSAAGRLRSSVRARYNHGHENNSISLEAMSLGGTRRFDGAIIRSDHLQAGCTETGCGETHRGLVG